MTTERERRAYYQAILRRIVIFIDSRLGSGSTHYGNSTGVGRCNILERLETLIDSKVESPTPGDSNSKQVDGNHYQTEIQPWDFIEANKLTFIEGNIVKYVARHRKKNGVRDLMKAKHYLEKLIEIEQSKPLGDNDVEEN